MEYVHYICYKDNIDININYIRENEHINTRTFKIKIPVKRS